MKRKILVTSALPYANGPLHLGHLVEYTQTDIWARYQRLRGHECLYFCADDAHGTPIMLRAQSEGITPEALIERMHAEHLRDFTDFGIGFDLYHSTHAAENFEISQDLYRALRANEHIIVREIEQAYDPVAEMFLPDRFIRGTCPRCKAPDQYGDNCEVCGATYSPTDLLDARSAVSGATPVRRSSEHYFFELGDFTEFLQQWIHSGTLQEEMANKLDEWFTAGLSDWDISRDAPYFGIPIPDAPGKFFYVWLDALPGYMAATQHWCNRHGRNFDEFWGQGADAELYHFIGKDIIYFHALFWPAMLQGSGHRLPTGVFAHGHLTVNGAKMSKSRGTSITARQYLDQLDPEFLRYYFACKLNSHVEDIDLNLEDFLLKGNGDLVGKVVNLASRAAGFIHKHFAGHLADSLGEDQPFYAQLAAKQEEIAASYEAREYARAMREIMTIADQLNAYVDQHAPWLLAKDDTQRDTLQRVCTVILNGFRLLITLLSPVLPRLAQRSCAFLRCELSWDGVQQPLLAHGIEPYSHLLQRMEKTHVDSLIQEPSQPIPPAPSTTSKAEQAPKSETIGIEDFGKVDLRIARIVAAEAVEGADKLLHLTLDIGEAQTRSVFAGIKSAYDPATLVGRLTVMVANLAPRKMRFGLSEGMVLAASGDAGGPFLLSPDSGAQPGMRVK
ncbi:methionine--tRNA ligase [Acidithiobacillus sp. CV18-2]|uniref:Methionine--tRNA ligase n=1 Tax=Igneacidithiobacillus copahuensis TaxID=2724909 RepID=A0AAE2YMY2_9PROT|nr:methionine--tRNA ligase [Igneacidithiobacillus copahuensis]MBU2753735.1 methionine--tRNA ligase [Acidithiobacillus sp. CV18-3]MBU2758273.1 methionine--tRNA ligase [Acidithiobacillus sp. BN09-2]MBU2778074.1 methionine--tRNA ligase [Acidithiobacillus sp. CV18-2]MBU2796030.1 methionine--tRNA ligase [Acidithiobacillus sp. VAN18-2]MBU2798041.1 methionine--tRNA ligase [Acidithiobacillus sp. VAN18-4]UTV80306.1 methionine--tRNA ligase [Acidithiobacillus sp. YTS05]